MKVSVARASDSKEKMSIEDDAETLESLRKPEHYCHLILAQFRIVRLLHDKVAQQESENFMHELKSEAKIETS